MKLGYFVIVVATLCTLGPSPTAFAQTWGAWGPVIQIKDTSSALDTLGMHREIAHAVIMPNAATPKVLLWALHNCGVSSEIDDETRLFRNLCG